MSAFLYIGLTQFLIGLALLVIASYYDIKLRKASDIIWIVMGSSAIILLAFYVHYGRLIDDIESVLMIGIVPLLGIFSYFLMCDWLVDFETRTINMPWIFIIIISVAGVLVLGHLIELGNQELIFITVFFVGFIGLEFYIYYLDHSHYVRAMESKKSRSAEKKKIKTVKNDNTRPKEDKGMEEKDPLSRPSWSLAGLLLILLLVLLYYRDSDLVIATAAVVIVTILFTVIYFKYYDWQIIPEPDIKGREDAEPQKKMKKNVKDEKEPEPEIDPRRRTFMEKSGWTVIIIFGVLLIINIIYISRLDNSNGVLDEGTDNARYYLALFSAWIWLVIFYALYNLGVPKGGADTKALMGLALLFPIYVFFEPVLINGAFLELIDMVPGIAYIFPFAFSVLINATFVTIIIPLSLLVYNVSKGDRQFPACLFGYKMDLMQISKRHVWLMDRIDEDGNIRTILSPGDLEDDRKMIKTLKKKGRKSAWVTPKIPFIVPMTIGFVLNFLVGNILFVIIYGLQAL